MKTKKRSSSQILYEIRCESKIGTKRQFLLANFRAVNPHLGVLSLDLHSSSSKPVNFFGAQSSLGEAQFSFGGHKQSFGGGGGRPRNAHHGARPAIIALAVICCRYGCVEFHLNFAAIWLRSFWNTGTA